MTSMYEQVDTTTVRIRWPGPWSIRSRSCYWSTARTALGFGNCRRTHAPTRRSDIEDAMLPKTSMPGTTPCVVCDGAHQRLAHPGDDLAMLADSPVGGVMLANESVDHVTEIAKTIT